MGSSSAGIDAGLIAQAAPVDQPSALLRFGLIDGCGLASAGRFQMAGSSYFRARRDD